MASRTAQVIPIEIAPGITRNDTAIEAKGRWVDSQWVRFRNGSPEKINGFSKQITSGTFRGVCRATFEWSAINGVKYRAAGTHNHLYILTGGQYYDITPIRESPSLTNPITTTSGLDEVSILDNSHGLAVGDFVFFGTPVVYNGITFSGEYEVTTVTDANNYKFFTGTNASGSGTGGGTFTINYYLTSGLVDSGIFNFGFGTGTYGSGTWGTARATGAVEKARVWQFQPWGEDLISLVPRGPVYYWDTSVGTGTRAAIIATAPDDNNFMLVHSSSRQLILFGTETSGGVFDPMLIRWSDSEDYTEFTLSVGNAGEYRVTKGTEIISAVETRNNEVLVFTDTAVYIMRPTVTDNVFDITLLSENSGILSPNAVVDVDGIVYWQSHDGWRVYDGSVRVLVSTLEQYYYDQDEDGIINYDQRVKCFVGKDRDYNEIWFFLPTNGAVEINRYVVYNYKEDLWYDGSLRRTAWSNQSIDNFPYAYDYDGSLYAHEQTKNADGAVQEAYIEAGFYDISNADSIMFCDRFIPDGSYFGPITLTMKAKKFPQSSEVVTKTYTFDSTHEQVPVRLRGRFINFKLTTSSYNGEMRIGKLFASVKEDGGR